MSDPRIEIAARALAPLAWAALGSADTLAQEKRRNASLRHARAVVEALDREGGGPNSVAYQIVGAFSAMAGVFEHPEIIRALDYLSDPWAHPDPLPWPGVGSDLREVMEGDASHDHVTPYDDTCTIEQRIDEIVATRADVHFEMMDENVAWMRVDGKHFWFNATKGKLIVKMTEDEDDPGGAG